MQKLHIMQKLRLPDIGVRLKAINISQGTLWATDPRLLARKFAEVARQRVYRGTLSVQVPDNAAN